mmetsp:Transcript_52749/g.163341  ORF Transcript_52749/g.163341 Transcript_52749/m.163341 type:complete len:385 (-) Transcript_52749:81-1235(-)
MVDSCLVYAVAPCAVVPLAGILCCRRGTTCMTLSIWVMGAWLRWNVEVCTAPYALLQGAPVEEPAGLASTLGALPARELSWSERLAYEEDGVAFIPGLLPEKHALEIVRRHVVHHSMSHGRSWEHSRWLTNGALRSLIRDGPLASLASSALGGIAVRILLAEVWARTGIVTGASPWHRDDKSQDRCSGWRADPAPLVTVWLALTDAPEALEFIHGSHMFDPNCSAVPDEVAGCDVDQHCLGGEYIRNVSRRRGSPAPSTYSFHAGDAVVFKGLTLHRGLGKLARVSVCLRFVPADLNYAGPVARQMDFFLHEYRSYKPTWCKSMDGPLFPVVYPRSNATIDAQQWPVLLGEYELFWWRFVSAQPRLADLHDLPCHIEVHSSAPT